MYLKAQDNMFFLPLVILAMLLAQCHINTKQNALHPSECIPFKEGIFYNALQTYKVERSGNKQTEYDLTNNVSYHFEVHWLYDCAYNLTFKHSTNITDTFALKANDMLRIQMIETTDTSFVYEVDFNDKRFKNVLYSRTPNTK